MPLSPNDITVFFFGATFTGFKAFPQKYSKWVTGYDTIKSPFPVICRYSIKDNKTIFKYIEYNLSDNIRSGRNFGIWLQIKNYKLKRTKEKEVLEFIKDFVTEVLEEREVFFKKGKKPHHYIIKSFDDVDTSKIIKIFIDEFIKYFRNDFVPIQKNDYLEKDLIKYQKPTIEREKFNKSDDENKKITIQKKDPVFDKKITPKKNKLNNKLSKKKYLLIIAALLIFLVIPIIICLIIDPFKAFYDKLFLFTIWAFIAIVVYKFFIKNNNPLNNQNKQKAHSVEHPLDDNRFIAITSSVAIIGLILTIYSKALIDNNSNINSLINNSISDESEFIIKTNKKTRKKYILCFDKSGSINEATLNTFPQNITKDKLKQTLGSIGLPYDEEKDQYNFVEDGMKAKKASFLNKIRMINIIAQSKYEDSIFVALFGNNTIIERIGDKEEKKDLVRQIIKASDSNDETNFWMLFKELNKNSSKIKSIFKENSITLVIYSDFIHDVKKEKDKNFSGEKDSIINAINDLKNNDFGIHFEIIRSYPKKKLSQKNNRIIIDVEKIFDSIVDKKNYTKYTDINDWRIYYNIYLKSKRIKLFYRNALIDSSDCHIRFEPAYPELTYNFKFIYDTAPIHGDFYYCLNDRKKRNINTLNNVKANDNLRLHYYGFYTPSTPNVSLLVSNRAKKEKFNIDIVYVNVMRKSVACIFKILLIFLFIFEIIYIFYAIKR